jgi:hypothetical protein
MEIRSQNAMPTAPMDPAGYNAAEHWISKHLTFCFSSRIVIKLFYILLLHIAMYIALLEKSHDHLHDANSVMHVKCFILNLLRNKDCDAWLFYILLLRWYILKIFLGGKTSLSCFSSERKYLILFSYKIMLSCIEFLNILPFVLFVALLSNSFTFYYGILLCV